MVHGNHVDFSSWFIMNISYVLILVLLTLSVRCIVSCFGMS